MKGANRYMKMIMTIQKKFCFGKWVNQGPKLTYQHNSGSIPKIFLYFAQEQRLMVLMKKNLVKGKWSILDTKMVPPHIHYKDVHFD